MILVTDIVTCHFCDVTFRTKPLIFVLHLFGMPHAYNFISYQEMKIHCVNTSRSHCYALIIVAILRSAHRYR
jgi:hypothetical protein